MKPFFSLLAIIFMIEGRAQELLPKVSSGTVERLFFHSAYTSSRQVDVWLPEGYTDAHRYSVLYMHDGQMLYDASTTWNAQAWEVDEVAGRLQKDNQTEKFIVVGIWNGGESRHSDYFPQKPFEAMTEEEKGIINAQLKKAGRSNGDFRPGSDYYLKFIVNELKPFIDKTYAVHSDRDHTFIMGSSMGGLISFYALCEYPEVFGGAACLSTHWIGTIERENNPIPQHFFDYLEKSLPSPQHHRIYFDTGDQTLDALYPPFQERADAVMRSRGYDENHWITKYFPGEDHSEKSWSKRLAVPLLFLFGK